jgi:hypothetical protein
LDVLSLFFPPVPGLRIKAPFPGSYLPPVWDGRVLQPLRTPLSDGLGAAASVFGVTDIGGSVSRFSHTRHHYAQVFNGITSIRTKVDSVRPLSYIRTLDCVSIIVLPFPPRCAI